MARYFHFMSGLRGCYMPDNAFVIRCDTRRELRSAIAYECDSMREAYGHGAPAREITATAAALWRCGETPSTAADRYTAIRSASAGRVMPAIGHSV